VSSAFFHRRRRRTIAAGLEHKGWIAKSVNFIGCRLEGNESMKHRGWIAVAAFALLGPNAALAADATNFNAMTAGDLVALCSATPDNGIGTAALNFCEGYLQGAVTVEMQNLAPLRGHKLFCLPNPPPTRSQAMSEFVGWAQAAPDRLTQSTTDGLFRFLSERYPCP
jgi:hypothetical protein